MLLPANSKVMSVNWSFHRNTAHIVEHSNEIDIFIGKIHHTVRMFCHDDAHLLPQAHRNAHCHDRTRRGKHHFVPILCSGSNLVSFPLGCTVVPGLELGTRLWFVDWITDESYLYQSALLAYGALWCVSSVVLVLLTQGWLVIRPARRAVLGCHLGQLQWRIERWQCPFLWWFHTSWSPQHCRH